MTFKTAITKDQTSTEPEYCREGDAVAFNVLVEGVVTSLATPTMAIYKEGVTTDRSSDFLAGSMSVSGFTIITKTTTGLVAGNWILSISATVDGQVQNVATIPLIVKRKSER